jgi:3-isopropylmalate dehydrogenase
MQSSSIHALASDTLTVDESLPSVLARVAPGAKARPEPGRLIGLLPGEGVGAELFAVVGDVLDALAGAGMTPLELRTGGAIGWEAEASSKVALTGEVTDFCAQIFGDGGALLCGPGAGRFVYDLRRRFDLYCKLVPIRPAPELADTGCIRPEHRRGVDLLVVRENVGGIYQGTSRMVDGGDERSAEHTFSYKESDVRRILRAGARFAAERRGILDVVVKSDGVPAPSRLWKAVAEEVSAELGVRWRCLDIDFAAYRIIQHAGELDVIIAPNLFGDVLGDLGGVLLGSRGLCYSANFTEGGAAVYQTGHGAAFDLAGTDRANPSAQLFSLAMLLRESLGRPVEAAAIEKAIARVWRGGVRTADVAGPGSRVVGTRAFGAEVARAAAALYRSRDA